MTQEMAEMIKSMRIKQIHFAWDRYEDRDRIVPKLREFQQITGWGRDKMTVYVLTGYDATIEQDLERIYTLRDIGYSPYVMIYDKESRGRHDILKELQRWVNNKRIFWTEPKFEEYGGQTKCRN